MTKAEIKALKLLSGKAMTLGEFGEAMYGFQKAVGIASAVLGRLIGLSWVELDSTNRYGLTPAGRTALDEHEAKRGKKE